MVNVDEGTLSSGTASTTGKEFNEGNVYYSVDVTGLTGSVTIQRSPDDGTTWISDTDGTFSADDTGTILHGGGWLRFTSSISGGSAAVKLWQQADATK